MWPVYVYMGLQLFGLGVVLAKHGESQGNYNIGTTMLSCIIVWFVLYKGGFFVPLGLIP